MMKPILSVLVLVLFVGLASAVCGDSMCEAGEDMISCTRDCLDGLADASGTSVSYTDPDSGVTFTLQTSSSGLISLLGKAEKITKDPYYVEMAFDIAGPSTTATISGLNPNTEYHLYTDSYNNHQAFTTDASGAYSFTQDTSAEHLVWIQDVESTITITYTDPSWPPGGQCYLVGTWNDATKTCTLNQPLTESVEIMDSGITLDCAGYSITGTGTGYGVYANGVSGLTIKNCNVNNFYYGIYLLNSDSNTITGNTLNDHSYMALRLHGSSNTVKDNTANYNDWGGLFVRGDHNTIDSNSAEDNDGFGISVGYHITDNTITNNYMKGSGLNDTWYGLVLGSLDSTVTGNTITGSYMGLYFQEGISTHITGNTVDDNYGFGIIIEADPDPTWPMHSNVINDNYITNTVCPENQSVYSGVITANGSGVGLAVYPFSGPTTYFSNNTFYNNFISNKRNFVVAGAHQGYQFGFGDWNTTKTAGTNIIGGAYLAGNYWAEPNGTGFSQTCTDSNADGICDSAYNLDADNVDYLPLTYPTPTTYIIPDDCSLIGHYESSTSTCYLDQDVFGTVEIHGDRITLDGSDPLGGKYTIDATGGDHAVSVVGRTSVTIKRVETTNANLASIFVSNSPYATLDDVYAHDNTGTGIEVEDSGDVTVDYAVSERNGLHGLAGKNSYHLEITRSIVNVNDGDGFLLRQADAAVVSTSIAENNGGDGIKAEDSGDVTLSSVVTNYNGLHGIWLGGCWNPAVEFDESTGNPFGVLIENSTNVNIADVNLTDNTYDGLQIKNSEQINLQRVVAINNGGNGGYCEYCIDLAVLQSDFTYNILDGFHVPHDAKVYIEGSTFSNNLRHGINLEDKNYVQLINIQGNNNGGYGLLYQNTVMEPNEASFTRDSVFSENAQSGIKINNLGCGTCVDNNFTILNSVTDRNGENGIYLTSNTVPTFVSLTSADSNTGDGVLVEWCSDVVIEGLGGGTYTHNWNGIRLVGTTGVLIYRETLSHNLNAGLLVIDAVDTKVSNSLIEYNKYGIAVDDVTTQVIDVNNVVENNYENYHTEEVGDYDEDGVLDDEDDCPYTYGMMIYNGCPAAIFCKVTSNDVLVTGEPGQQPLAGAMCKSFWTSDTCVAARHPDSTRIVEECAASSACLTGGDGTCLMGVEEGSYGVAAIEPTKTGYPYHSIGLVEAANSPKVARLAFLRSPDGKTTPGKSSKKTGSELWIYEPQYVVWNGTEEYFPFVFESEENWTVDVCLDPPQGYEPVDGVDCIQQMVAGQPKSILFRLIETGSMPDDVKVRMTLTTPQGKKLQVLSTVGTRLTENLAKAKGVAIDKNGVITGRAAHTEGLPVSPMFFAALIGLGLLGFAVDAFRRRKRKR